MVLSIVIPILNEVRNIGILINHFQKIDLHNSIEIIVSPGGNLDNTCIIASSLAATICTSSEKGRALQMNEGAAISKGEILYFVHAHTIQPLTFVKDINKAILSGYDTGRYQTKFDSNSWLLMLNAFFTRFYWEVCYGGDQTLFIKRTTFEAIGCFKKEMKIMEEYEFVKKARVSAKYTILNGKALVSARKFSKNSWLQVQRANAKIINMYKQGASQEVMVAIHKKLFNSD